MAVLKIRDSNGNVQEILAIKGKDGKDYVLTEKDKQEIAAMISAGAVATVDIDTSEFALKTDIPDVSGFVTEAQVQAMIDRAIAKLNAVIISFSIEDFSFQAVEGMTWREWVDSEYNADGACVYNEGTDTIRFVEYSLDVLQSSTPVNGSDPIISGHFYYLS